jgi:non-homologous end joining protein Ku
VKAPAAREARVFDLADALKRSVEAAKKGAKPKPPARARARPSRPPRRTRKVG